MESNDYRTVLGEHICELRTSQGISQRRFALMIGTNQTYLWRIEKGTTNVGIDLLYRIAKGLDVRVKDLIDF